METLNHHVAEARTKSDAQKIQDPLLST